jgi:hypothetical protein
MSSPIRTGVTSFFELMNTSHEARDVSEIQHTGWGCPFHGDGVDGVH